MHKVSVLVLSLLYLCLGDLVVNQFGPVLVEDFYADSYDHSGSTPAYTLTAADDFTVPTTYSMTINSVQFSGHFVAGTYSDKNVRNWTVLIYGDTISATFPGYHVPNTANLIASQVQIATNVTFPNITVNVSFTSPPTLQSGQYWIGIYASMQGAALTYYFNVDRLQTSTPYGERFVSKETVANYYSAAYTNKWIPYNESSLFQPGEFGTGGYNLAFNLYGSLNDITPPSVSTFIFSPTSFDFSSGKTMNFTLVASDNDGVKAVKMSLHSPNKVSAVSFKLDTGNNWIYNTNFSFDPTAGSWSVIEIDVVDYAENWKNYTSAQIQSLFGPYNSFSVFNSLATTSTSTSSTTTSPSTTISSTSMSSTSTTSISATTSDATTSSSSISTSSSSSPSSGDGTTTGGITSTTSDMSTTTITSSTSASVNSSDVNNIKSTGSSSSNIIPIIGGAVGGFIALVAIALILFFVLRRKRNNKTTKQEPAHNEVAMGNYNNFNSSSSSVGSLYMPMSTSTSTSTNVSRTPSRANLDTSIVITYTELKIENEVGSGAFGVVFRGRWRGGAVAIKQISGRLTPKQLSDFTAEASIMKNLRPHVNVVQFLGVTLHPDPLCLVTEFLDQGSLYSFMRRNKLDTKMLMNIVRGIASGMLHLHSEGLIHRDLASRNILLGSGQQVKISDFGMSRANSEEQNQTKSETGPLKWMAPESIRDRVYSTATDVWSFGVTVWEIVTVEDPFPNLDSVQAALGIVHNKLRLKIPDNCPFVLSKVMNLCFKTDPAQRPSFDVILSTLQNAAIEEWSFT